MRTKLLEATRGYFKDDLSAEAAIDIIMGILRDNHYAPTTSHIGKALLMAREMGKECIVVIGAENPIGPQTKNISEKLMDIEIPTLDKYCFGYQLEVDKHKHTHKRKSSREI
jgi:hypothetical protein